MIWKSIWTPPCMLGAAILLSGCAGLANETKIDWEHGARRGTVTRVFDATTGADQRPACLAQVSADMLSQRQYVELRYQHRRHYFLEAGALPAGVRVNPGDVVEFYPKDCDAGVLSILIRVLPPAPQ
jgi:hypothetical protein